jgi:hypothetical protein
MARTTADLRGTSSFRGVPVSRAHRIVLTAAAEAGVRFDVNDGRRTLAVQAARIAKHGLWSPSNPTGAAPARQSSPHVKYGRAHHALDVDQFTAPVGGQLRLAAFYRRRGVPVAFNVPTEAWHLDVLSEAALMAAARRLEPAPDPFAAYPADEARWLREYDALPKTVAGANRRRVLRRYMLERRKSIWRAAQESGWDKLHRRARYRSLLARTT